MPGNAAPPRPNHHNAIRVFAFTAARAAVDLIAAIKANRASLELLHLAQAKEADLNRAQQELNDAFDLLLAKGKARVNSLTASEHAQ